MWTANVNFRRDHLPLMNARPPAPSVLMPPLVLHRSMVARHRTPRTHRRPKPSLSSALYSIDAVLVSSDTSSMHASSRIETEAGPSLGLPPSLPAFLGQASPATRGSPHPIAASRPRRAPRDGRRCVPARKASRRVLQCCYREGRYDSRHDVLRLALSRCVRTVRARLLLLYPHLPAARGDTPGSRLERDQCL
ncbi:hypothetical protein FKP32DRAFT_1187397 [Trametes sanguinea]|nr:hypothetical protein FKP32DRAFT_1187397 [Trametes sanguinea]